MAVKLIIEKDENEKFPAYTGINDEQGWVDGTTPLNAANLNISETALKAWFGESGHISNLITQVNKEDTALSKAIENNLATAKTFASEADAVLKSGLEEQISTNTTNIANLVLADSSINNTIKDLLAEDADIKENITNLQTYVGDIPEDVDETVNTVINYIDFKTQGLVTNTSFSKLSGVVGALGTGLDRVENTLSKQDATIQSLQKADEELQKQIDDISGIPEDFTSFIKSGDTIQLIGMNATQILNPNS